MRWNRPPAGSVAGQVDGKDGEESGQGPGAVARKSRINDQHLLIPLPPLHWHSPLFNLSTPTAPVTDLGTEFGVEVLQAGLTLVHVLEAGAG